MLFNFELTPLKAVEPWGTGDDRSLHWFGLTDGSYWLDVGDQRLFEYSAAARESGAPRYCSYQVVRLHEDVLEMTPAVLEAIPVDLIARISGREGQQSVLRVSEWRGLSTEQDDDAFWSTLDGAQTWISKRHLDSLYLSPGVNVNMWSDAEFVHIEWDNSPKLVGEVCAWTAVNGSLHLPRAKFIEEVRSFHQRLIDQMAERVENVLAGNVLPPEVQIDYPGLVREQARRSELLEAALRPASPTDWNAVRRSFAVVDATVA